MADKGDHPTPPMVVDHNIWFPQRSANGENVSAIRAPLLPQEGKGFTRRNPTELNANSARQILTNVRPRLALGQLDRNSSVLAQLALKQDQTTMASPSAHSTADRSLSPLHRSGAPAQHSTGLQDQLARVGLGFQHLGLASNPASSTTSAGLNIPTAVPPSQPRIMTYPQAPVFRPAETPSNAIANLEQPMTNVNWPTMTAQRQVSGQTDFTTLSQGSGPSSGGTNASGSLAMFDQSRSISGQDFNGFANVYRDHQPAQPVAVPAAQSGSFSGQGFNSFGNLFSNSDQATNQPTSTMSQLVPDGFRPMRRVLGESGNPAAATNFGTFTTPSDTASSSLGPSHLLPLSPDEPDLSGLLPVGTSRNYKGNPFLPSNQSADIAEDSNCAVWITNLPPDCTVHLLLGQIRGCGKVYATVINPPASGSSHTTAAAKVVFFARRGVDVLIAQARAGGFAVGGYVPRVCPNRIRSAAKEAGPQCRVIHVEGPAQIINAAYLADFFAGKFSFEVDEVRVLYEGEGRRRLEWRFGSYRCQAETARQAIVRERMRYEGIPEGMGGRELWGQVSVHFGVDPCA